MVLAETTKTNLRLYTVEEFWDFIERPENADGKYELINGVILKHASASFEHGETALYIGSPLMLFARQHDLGKVAVEVDHYLLPDRFNTRHPDIEFISKARLAEFDPTQHVPLMPDLAVEIKSPTNSIEELAQKAAYYLQNGSHMVWLVYPETKEVAVYTLANPTPIIYGISDSLSGGDVLPGFELPVKDIFPV